MFGSLQYPDFAYSGGMQILLLLITLVANMLYGYLMTNIILSLFGERADFKQKLFFSILTYITSTLLIYFAYALSGFQSLSHFVYMLVTVPSPFISLLAYVGCVRILKVPRYRAVHLCVLFYLYALIQKAVTSVIGLAFFTQPPDPPYNYLLDVLAIVSGVVVSLMLYWVLKIITKRLALGVKLSESQFVKSISGSLAYAFLINCFAYTYFVTCTSIFYDEPLAHLFMAISLLLCMMIDYYRITTRSRRLELQNKSAHIESLSRSLDEFRGLKHDFYNILQTYSGYILLGDVSSLSKYHESLLNTTIMAGEQLELNERMEENPALISLLMEKRKYAEKQDVCIRINIECDISDMHIDNMNLCRALACLLDNAIEAAHESKEKMTAFSIRKKKNDNTLIVITNSTMPGVDVNHVLTSGKSTKDGHSGLGISQVRNTLSKFGNCVLQFECYSERFAAYIEIM